jgi:N-acetylglucosamine-6-phosphate deacetylase
MPTTILANRLITANQIIQRPLLTLEDATIAAISSLEDSDATTVTHHWPEATITAGLFDVHTHGAVGHDVMEGSADAFRNIGKFLALHGVTEYLATTVTASMDFTKGALAAMARHMERGPEAEEARIAGIHIEGPFLSHAKRGMHPPNHLQRPSPDILEQLWQASEGRIVLMTIAPELPGAIETIARAHELGIRCSIGHSDADTPQTVQALKTGVASATHTFNAMRTLNQRDPGILGLVLDRDEIYSDLICDGVHVAPELVRLWLKAKGPERAILITDALEATGMPNGVYKLGETRVHVQDGRCTTDEGVLAGSVLTLDQAVTNVRSFTNCDLTTAVRLASSNPLQMLRWQDRLRIGGVANFNVFDPQGERVATVLRGKLL